MSDQEIIELQKPNLSLEKLKLVVSALRPFRVGGLRLEKDYFKGKTVYHNYGHGAWGLNLSYCTGLIQVNEFEKDQGQIKDYNQQVVVLGCGIVGLMTSLILLERGYKVKIISEQFLDEEIQGDEKTKFQKKEKYITSQFAAGFIKPFGDKELQNFPQLSLKQIQKSHDFFQKCVDEQIFKGLSYMDFYEFSDNFSKTSFKQQVKNVFVRFGTDGIIRKANKSTIIQASESFIFDLFNRVKKLGATLQTKTINKYNFNTIGSEIVFNCTGIGSAEIFDDQQVYPVKGQLLYFEKDPKINYTLAQESENDHIQLFNKESYLVIGGIFIKTKTDDLRPTQKYFQQILNNNLNFFNEKQIKPKL